MSDSGAIRLRHYAPGDLDALIALFRDTVRRVARRDYTEAQVLAWAPDTIDRAAWAERRASRPTWVAHIGADLAGFIDLEPDGHIDMLFVHADHQRRGVASALIAHVDATAREQQLQRLFTEASITARPVFLRHGFREIEAQVVAKQGQSLINYRMEKRLA